MENRVGDLAGNESTEFVRPTVTASLSKLIEGQIRALVLDGPFPCSGAKAALNDNSYRFNAYPSLAEPTIWPSVAADLARFVSDRHSMGQFYTFIASFLEPAAVTDHSAWDRLFWSFLQSLHDLDKIPWDPRFSANPDDGDFAFSFAGCGMLVVSLYPGSTRYARRFAWPTIVFNPLEQDRQVFPDPRELDRFVDRIRRRDARLQGSVNPSLPSHAGEPQAPGFSGAPISANWRCPLNVRPDLLP